MASHLRERKIIPWLLVVFLTIALTASILGTTLSAVQKNRTINDHGRVKGIGVGVYWDSACTNATSSIDWGVLDPGSSNTVTFYVRNEGNSAATLSMATQNWNPSTASTYMSLYWDYKSQILNVNQPLQVKLTLSVSSTASGIADFTFDIIIVASG